MAVVQMKNLLEAGVHFGHQTRRWNPKMGEYIFTERNGIHIIDLQKTSKKIDEAYEFVRARIAEHKTILFVGTKKQAQEVVESEAKRVDMPFVNARWLGGMLTNFQTIRRRLERMNQLDKMEENGTFDLLTKKEVLTLKKEKARLERYLGGIRNMTALPGVIFVVDPKMEHIAVSEARKLGIPVVGIVDTNCDPDDVDYVIPANDDAIRSVKLVVEAIANAAIEAREGTDLSATVVNVANEGAPADVVASEAAVPKVKKEVIKPMILE